MRTSAFVAALLVATVQTVGWAECCCIVICKHRNARCSDCEKEGAQKSVEADCCKKKASASKHEDHKRCTHVEPSNEVLVQVAASPLPETELVLLLPPVVSLPVLGTTSNAPAALRESRGSPPLHLLYSTLLI